jgi:DnaK suppressor protein
MEHERALQLVRAERARVEALVADTSTDGRDDRQTADSGGDMTDPAERLTAEQGDDAVTVGLRQRLAALDRAERRIEEGTYGYSVRSGSPIPDARLEADPAAELTVDEANEAATVADATVADATVADATVADATEADQENA